MPECLNDQEGMFPGRYDPLYDQVPNQFEPGHDNSFKDFLQSKALGILHLKLSPEKLQDIQDHLNKKGLMNKSMTDPAVVETVEKYLKNMKMAKRMLACQI